MKKKTKDETISTNQERIGRDEIMVMTSDPLAAGTRGSGLRSLKVEEFTLNVNTFVEQMGKILENTPETVGKFHFEEFEINAEINADGTLAILGSGIHAGTKGGLRFVFRRGSASDE